MSSVIREIAEVKRETLINIAKKIAFPLTLIPVVWIIFLRKTGVGYKGTVISKPALEGAAGDIVTEGGSSYNLKNLVCFLYNIYLLSSA